jgi:hypothetical protein
VVTRIVGQLSIDVAEDGAVVGPHGNREPGTGNGERGTGNNPLGTRDLGPGTEELRNVVRFDDLGRYRPLSGAKSLPGGWRVRCPVADVDDVIEVV